MPVNVLRHLDRAMAHLIGDVANILALSNQKADVRMPQRMQPGPWEAEMGHGYLKVAADLKLLAGVGRPWRV